MLRGKRRPGEPPVEPLRWGGGRQCRAGGSDRRAAPREKSVTFITSVGERDATIRPAMDFLKTVTGKVISGIAGLVVVIAGISWWRMDPETKHMLLAGTGRIVSWLGLLVLIPWATFFVIAWVGRMD